MSPNPPSPGGVRPAAAVNDAIRAIVRGAIGRQWTHAERTLYGLLLDEWADAIQGETAAAV